VPPTRRSRPRPQHIAAAARSAAPPRRPSRPVTRRGRADCTPEFNGYIRSVNQPIVAVFGASRTVQGDADYVDAERCGRLLAEAGYGIVTGGYGGSMEAASKGAAGAGGRVVGVTAPSVFPQRPGANAFVGEEIVAPTVPERIRIMLDMATASISLAGSIGTLTELMVAWNVAYIARFSSTIPNPVIAVGAGWQSVVTEIANRIPADAGVVSFVDDVDAAVDAVQSGLGPQR